VSFALALTVVAAFCSRPLLTQTNLETNAGVQFNFSTPGAGNLALGGAFLALAFDASAAYTNPAGLTTIAAPESLVELRHWNYTHLFTDLGRIAGQLRTNEGQDRIAGLRDGRAENRVTGLSFISYVVPRHRWSYAVYRHELVNFEADFSSQGAFLERTAEQGIFGIPGERDGRLAALKNRMDVDITAYGGAAACRLGQGVSLGLTISYFDFAIDSLAERFRQKPLDQPPQFTDARLVNRQSQAGKDSDWGFAAGFLWEGSQGRWSAGGVYRQGPDFALKTRSEAGESPEAVPFPPVAQTAGFHVPDVWGVGVAFRPSDAFRLAFDYDRISYSELLRGFVDIFDLTHLPQIDPASPKAPDPELNRFEIDDTGELHLGMEYALLKHWPVLTLRAGGWYEPDHSLRFEGDNPGFRAVFRQRKDQMHYTAGVGLALRRLQLDAAIDHSDRASVVALSAGLRY